MRRACLAFVIVLLPSTAFAEDETPPPLPETLRTAVRVDGGYARRNIYELDFDGADVGGAIGAHQGSFAIWAAPRVFVGSSENGLSIWSFRMAAEAEGTIANRFVLGAGAGLFWVGIGRAAREDTMLSGGITGNVFARVNFVREERTTFFLRAGVEGGVEINRAAAFWGPTIGVGIDFDLGRD